MSPSNTAFIFVPGAWCPGSYYQVVVDKLALLSFTSKYLNLPSIGKKDFVPTLSDDISHVRSEASAFLDAGKDVIIVGNSYGGFVTLESCKGLTPADRSAAQKTGGKLKHIILIGTFLAKPGETMKDLVGPYLPLDAPPDNPWIEPIPGDAGYRFLCGSLPEEEGMRYGGMIEATCVAPFIEPLTFAAYEEVPTTYVIGGRDVALKPEIQEESYKAAVERGKGVQTLKKVKIETGDHCTMLSNPEDIVRVCAEAAQ